MAREIVTSENREKYIEEKMEKKSGRAKKGGETAKSNQYHYKGGQFLPTTSAEPGKWKVGGKFTTLLLLCQRITALTNVLLGKPHGLILFSVSLVNLSVQTGCVHVM